MIVFYKQSVDAYTPKNKEYMHVQKYTFGHWGKCYTQVTEDNLWVNASEQDIHHIKPQ